jgi:hypothetical protein
VIGSKRPLKYLLAANAAQHKSNNKLSAAVPSNSLNKLVAVAAAAPYNSLSPNTTTCTNNKLLVNL